MVNKSTKTAEERFWPKVDKSGDCWLWTGSRIPKGYGKFSVTRRKWCLSHRVSYEINIGPIPDGLHVLHHCDNPPCVNPSHLWLGTNLDNIKDKVAKGRQLVGSMAPVAKLYESDVIVIRELLSVGTKKSCICKFFDISRAALWRIAKRETWRHVPDPKVTV